MIKKIVIKNRSLSQLGVMLEPWTNREDADPEQEIVIEANFSEEDLIIEFFDENFISIWSPPKAKISRS
ncbi:hypothetical protein [Sphingopyxis sp.]|uniref:hypothetical protein n=1 Tax=Sphingopyxis sp. TaxID=1908224 RepID=UPI003BAD9547